MKTVSILIITIGLSIVYISCSSNQSKPDQQKKDSVVATADQLDINDNKFIFKNINSTKIISEFYFKEDKTDTDSTKRVSLTKLTKSEILLLLAPYIIKQKHMTDDPNFVRDNFAASFIAKQDKIGDLQPIIISAGMDDYSALIMILLDKNNKYISGYNIRGGFEGGPEDKGDVIMYDLDGFADINKNIITTYRLRRTDYKDTLKKTSLIDTNILRVVVDNNGNFIEKGISSKQGTIPNN